MTPRLRIDLEDPRTTALFDHLSLKAPTSPDKAPAILEFTRDRPIPIPWAEIIAAPPRDDVPARDDSSHLRRWFRKVWGRTTLGTLREEEGKLWARRSVVFSDHVEPVEAFVLLHPTGRAYVLIDAQGAPIDPGAVDDTTTFDALWSREPAAVELAFASQAERTALAPMTDYVSREVVELRDEYRRLDAMEKFGTKLAAAAEARTTGQEERWWLDPEAASADLEKYVDFTGQAKRAQELKRRLAARVSALGYTLLLADATISRPDGSSQTVVAGQIYRVRKVQIHWTSRHTVYQTYIRVGSCGRITVGRRPVVQTRYHSSVVDHWELVDFDSDPVQDEIRRLQGDGRHVYVVEPRDEGYMTADGLRLSDIVHRCEEDEDFRRKSVVVVEHVDPFITDTRRLLGARFFHRPLAGLRVIEFPTAALREQLSYNMMWTGTELGQLVRTINLGPGEERTVAIRAAFREEVATSSSFRRSLESGFEQTDDLTTEIQNEASREMNRRRESSVGANAGFGIGPFSFGANASTSSSTSLRTFSRTMNKVSRRAIKKVNRKMSVEVTARTDRTTTVEQESSHDFTVRNVNQGRTLNLVFHQVNNRFDGGLYLDDLGLVVTSGRELIDGSGLFERRVFELHELSDALEAFEPKNLPVPLADALGDAGYWRRLLDALVDILDREYMPPEDDNTFSTVDRLKCHPPTCALRRTADEGADIEAQRVIAEGRLRRWAADIDDVGELMEALQEALALKVLSTEPMEPDTLIVASGGLYADAVVGGMPATEPYSEGMRALEREKVAAEIERSAVQTEAERARAALLFGKAPAETLRITGIFVSDDRIDLTLSPPLSAGDWRAYFGNRVVADRVEPGPAGTATFRWASPPVPELEELHSRLVLVSGNGDERAVYRR